MPKATSLLSSLSPSPGLKRRLLIGGGVTLVPLLAIGVFIYLALAPKYVDRDLFAYIGLPYKQQDVVYSHSGSPEFGVAFARVSAQQAKAVLSRPSTVFSECYQKDVYVPPDDELRCTETWVPSAQIQPYMMTSNLQQGESLRQAQDAYKKLVENDSFCTYSPNLVKWTSVVVKHRLCVNPTNGYVMYVYSNP